MTETVSVVSTHGKEVIVKPDSVLEVSYEEIQSSPNYSSGYALRFPRVIRLRSDRKATEISTLEDIRSMYKKQKARKT